jgi:hypothetical protein
MSRPNPRCALDSPTTWTTGPCSSAARSDLSFTSWRSRPACVVGLLMARRKTVCRCPPRSGLLAALFAA